MKNLSKIKLHDATVLNDSEMKIVLGGSGSESGGMGGSGATDCSTTCSDGSTIEIKSCIGDCIAIDGKSVTCSGSSAKLTKNCV
jgi:hypothetical protein